MSTRTRSSATSKRRRSVIRTREPVAVYVKTGNAPQWSLPSEEKCGRFLRRDLLDVLGPVP